MTQTDTRTVKGELDQLTGQRLNELRALYYGIADNLAPLAEQLEFADLETEGDAGPLIEQHLILCQMMEAFKKIELGKYL